MRAKFNAHTAHTIADSSNQVPVCYEQSAAATRINAYVAKQSLNVAVEPCNNHNTLLSSSAHKQPRHVHHVATRSLPT